MADEALQEDNELEQELRLARARSRSSSARSQPAASEEEVGKLEGLVANKDRSVTFVMMGLFAAIGSTLGAIPFVGWIISLVTAGGIALCAFTLEGKPKLKASLVNVGGVAADSVAAVFGLNVIPEQVFTVLLIWLIVQYDAEKAERALKRMVQKTGNQTYEPDTDEE